MATVAAVIASTHHPFYYRASTSAGPERPPFADEWVAKIEAFRQTLTRAEPDVLVMVGSDHFHQLWLDNMPQFLVGKAPFFDANWYNEEREFGLPRMRLAGDEDLAAYLLREGLDAGFDLAFSNELRIDHSVTCPSCRSTPTSSRRRCPGPRGSSSWGGRCAGWSRRGRRTSGWPSSAPGTCRWSSAARASSARTGPTRSSTARRWPGSPTATSTAAWARSRWTACTPPAT